MSIAALALIGAPFTSGFLSKDAIVIAAFEWASTKSVIFYLVPLLLVLVSILTAFYISRLIFKVFFGEAKFSQFLPPTFHLKDADRLILIPMYILAFFCLYIPFASNPLAPESAWLLKGLAVSSTSESSALIHMLLPLLLLSSAALAIWYAWMWYVQQKYPLKERNYWVSTSRKQGGLNEIYHLFFTKGTLKIAHGLVKVDAQIDRINSGLTMLFLAIARASNWINIFIIDRLTNSLVGLSDFFAKWVYYIDKYIIDGMVKGIANSVYTIGNCLRTTGNGRIQYYLYSMFFIVLIGLLYIILR